MVEAELSKVVCQRTAGPLGPVLKNFKRTGLFKTSKLPKGPLRTSFLIQELLLGFLFFIFSNWLFLNFKPTYSYNSIKNLKSGLDED